MSAALFEIIILLLLAIIVSGQQNLPQIGECGILKKEYYYNQKNLTEIDEFPWMARVVYENKTDNSFLVLCNAVLISKWFVLLNANCFDYDDCEPESVTLGDWNKGNSDKRSDCDDSGRCAPVPKSYEIEEIIIHPRYNYDSKNNNIALLRLSKSVIYSDFIRPICLPSKDIVQMSFDNELLEVSGWYENSSVGQILAKSFVRVMKFRTCELRIYKIFSIDKKNSICAISCIDDYVYSTNSALMGTALVDDEPAYYYLIGMNIIGPSQCSTSIPHVYSRVDRYLDWIYDISSDFV